MLTKNANPLEAETLSAGDSWESIAENPSEHLAQAHDKAVELMELLGWLVYSGEKHPKAGVVLGEAFGLAKDIRAALHVWHTSEFGEPMPAKRPKCLCEL